MKKHPDCPSLFLFLFALCLLFAAPGNASFLHAPHDATHGLSCKSCHLYPFDAGVWPPDFPPASPNEDDTLRNFICLRCHDGTVDNPAELPAPAVKMHSSLVIGGHHADWTTECTDCHDPHFQTQLSYLHDSDLFLATGSIVTVNSTAQPDRTELGCALISVKKG